MHLDELDVMDPIRRPPPTKQIQVQINSLVDVTIGACIPVIPNKDWIVNMLRGV